MSFYSCTRFVAVALGAFLLFACGGGSGSSGFSLRTERAALQFVLDTGECVERKGVTFCPADQPDILADGTAVDTPFDETLSFDCFASAAAAVITDRCAYSFSFSGTGFESAKALRVASRTFDSDEPWSVVQPFQTGETGDVLFAGVEAEADASGIEATQIVVVAPVDPDDTTDQVAELADLGANLVFVVPEQVVSTKQFPDESDAIGDAAELGECAVFGPGLICPTDTSLGGLENGVAVGLPGPFFDTFVSVGVADGFTTCRLNDARHSCAVDLSLSTSGLFAGFYRVAARNVDSTDPLWSLSEEIFVMDAYDFDPLGAPASEFPATVQVVGATPNDTVASQITVQFAVLADPVPGPAGETVSLLEAVAGLYTFVSEPIEVSVIAAGP